MMKPLMLKGDTLGQKHKYYNELVKEVSSTNTAQEIKNISYCEPDIDNLLKIDIASNNKDVTYILEVLKCEDMLYVSRALKQSTWLINESKYADIINPDYIDTELIPKMTSKAGYKLILTIRLNLKDETRNELFYKYYEKKKELQTALKWLSNCSISFIEDVVEKCALEIPKSLIKRLCEKSITILEILARKRTYQIRTLLSNTTFLSNKDAEKFVTIINSQEEYYIPTLNAKCTKNIMKIRPDIIFDNFKKFAKKIHIPTFVKFLKRENIKEFLMKHFESRNLKSWFNFENLKPFISRMPSECRFDFIKGIFIEKKHDSSEISSNAEDNLGYENYVLCCAIPQPKSVAQYKWYRFAPFSIAFTDLKKLIRLESNPAERNEIFSVLISCTRRNPKNLHIILQYYRDKHMNEPFKFKSHFVNIVLSQSNAYRFDDKTWSVLNDIFCSMEVYSESENNVQLPLKHIIVHKVLHDAPVPDIVENKFKFDTLKSFQNKLNDEEKHKVFDYLYQFITKKIQNVTINTETDMETILEHIVSVLKLISDWKKNILNHISILEKISEVIQIKSNKCWSVDLSNIYYVNKSWRKHMFKESLYLHPTQKACLNALKHGPEILSISKDSICSNDSMNITQLLSKLRIYWPDTLAKDFEDTFRIQLDKNTKHNMSIRGLCILLQKNQLTDILNKYKPNDTKINWTETGNSTLNIQKCFAKYMYLARPHPPLQVVLLYAKGDYLQFVLPSVHSIFFNISSDQSMKYISSLLDAPVSLQKHGLKIAFTKVNIDEFLTVCLNMWNSNKNPSIRATIFKLMFDLLCKEQNVDKMKEIWNVIDMFIDSLTADENKMIYVTLGQANKVPLPVRQAYCMKSYRFLKSLPPKVNCDKFSKSVINSTFNIMEFIDIEFVVEIIFDTFDKKFTKPCYERSNIISACLLSTKTKSIQTQRYERIFKPLLNKYLVLIKNDEISKFHLNCNFNSVLRQLHEDIEYITINKNMITPIKLYNNIYNDLKENFPEENNYVLIMTWKLAAKYIEIIEKYRVMLADVPAETQFENNRENSKKNLIYSEAVPDFGKFCMEQLKEETRRYFPSIYRLFSKALLAIFNELRFNIKIRLATLKSIQEHADIIEGQLLVLKLLRFNFVNDDLYKDEISKICQILEFHPSAEVRMSYQQMLRDWERY